MTADNVKDFLEQNGLAEAIARLRDAAPHSLGPDAAEALAKMTLILRVLSLPPEAIERALRLVEELSRC